MKPNSSEPPRGAPDRSDPVAAATGLEVPVRDEVMTPPPDTEVTRRTALKLVSATALLAAGGLGCTRKPERHIVSVHDAPEYQKPGHALHYATTWTDGHVPYGLMVKSVDGRPVKIEGLPDHPLSRGRTTAQMQASLLSLYDPERLRAPRVDGITSDFAAADARVLAALRAARSVVLVTRSLLGPAERQIVARFLAAAPTAVHFVHETTDDRSRRAAWADVYGRDGEVVPDLGAADVILSLDADFLGSDGDVLTASREFAARRKVRSADARELNRLYVVEAGMSVTGSNADHRIPLGPRGMLPAVRAIAEAVASGDRTRLDAVAGEWNLDVRVLAALVADLSKAKGRAVVLAGGHLPAPVHAAVALLNEALDAPLQFNPVPATLAPSDPAELAAALDAEPDLAILLGVNPVYDAPGGGFAERLGKAKLSVGHGLTDNETLAVCDVALPSAHNLESWNDAAPLAGLKGIVQPMIAPLFDGRQDAESLLVWAKALTPADGDWNGIEDWHDFVRVFWGRSVLGGLDLERWEAALRKGWVGEPALMPRPAVNAARATALMGEAPAASDGQALDLVLLPHATVGDGRFAGNAWLQELPDPVSRLVWDNAVAVGPATAKRLGVGTGDRLEVTANGATVVLPVLLQPGTAPGVLAATLGQGRTAGAGVGDAVGVNAAPLQAGHRAPRVTLGVAAKKVAGEHRLVRTQRNVAEDGLFTQAKRPLVLDATREEYKKDPAFVKHRQHLPKDPKQLHAEFDYSKGSKWAMAIDLSACTGCGACAVACQAENNIFVVGKEEVDLGRELSWIRIDRYEEGDPANPTVGQQPMLCQHCDNAPCENVCPVNATAHSPEGLNEQVYNRCVGTRYCGNNCPYKVRRFNFLNYGKASVEDPVGELLYNPNVTVRMRGVMEKCTFCVQRINAAKFTASNAGEEVKDGDVVTACQQACPAQAIVFGDANDTSGEVARQRESDLAYHVLEELNVRPNVTYLARVRNPSPDAGDEGAR